ncbi:MAG: hypothetical protein HY466_05895, partial [Deltaproteobacteria bacterium]|nr:hypothetical protein [Deltaproteobacteria bacterium]
MVKKSFYIGLLNLLLWTVPAAAGPVGPAAHHLAGRLYRLGNHHLQTRQWDQALQAYRLAFLLDPFFAPAAQKKRARISSAQPKPADAKLLTGVKVEDSQVQKMLLIKNHLERGERQEAVLALTEWLREDPQNERARLLLEKIQKEGETGSRENPKFQEGEKLFKEGQKEEEGGNKLPAYQRYRQAIPLFAPAEIKPYFYRELIERQEALTGELLSVLDQKLDDLEKRDPAQAGGRLRELASQYPPSPRLQKMLSDCYAVLQARALPVL